eukprot:comp12271_c0_seq1/m.7093 comp12271_c0_seq1/g.7093  ORF comp12271_c0_seq1/g.7093 comp12271_c0_seq1/m.7093 type:complete len:192 (-) comp12271_c0_seq1:18-593(-)
MRTNAFPSSDLHTLPSAAPVQDRRFDYAYTIGCFDLAHEGHAKLFNNMRKIGKKVVVGVHDDASIYKLKNKVPFDSTEARVQSIKKYADVVFVVAGTDPSPFIEAEILRQIAHCTASHLPHSAIYVRGDDMPNFPAREVVEKYMHVLLLPYTQGVSSTLIRKELLTTNDGLTRLGMREREVFRMLGIAAVS